MIVAVLGLWHLGSVTAACLADAGHTVIAWDPDASAVDRLACGEPPVAEPGLADLIAPTLRDGRLCFVRDVAAAVRGAELVWITFDTPVDEEDRADVNWVLQQVQTAFPYLEDGAVVLSSSQLPVGSIATLERMWSPVAAGRRVSFASTPENLRLGRGIDIFTRPDRVVVGTRDQYAKDVVQRVWAPITDRLEWMSVESAEMTKHAINAFLATSVTFINEIATLCERVGADAKEVERGLKTESRIGPKAYLGPGAAFAGGTLARDVMFLRDLGSRVEQPTPVMDGVLASNRVHRSWAQLRLQLELGGLRGRRIAVWGLTYKPGTDTLRRSSAVELCEWLLAEGAQVAAHDPVVRALPSALAAVERCDDPVEAVRGADALVVATEWPEYRLVDSTRLAAAMTRPLVLDANRFLGATVGGAAGVRLISVGQARV